MKQRLIQSFSNTKQATLELGLARHSFNNLASLVQDVLEQIQTLYQTYFVKRGRFNPIDELAFEKDWKHFYQQVVQLEENLEQHCVLLKQVNRPELAEMAKLFEAQVDHYHGWCKQLRRNHAFNKQAALLATLLPHKQELNPPHPKLCCSKTNLNAIAGIIWSLPH